MHVMHVICYHYCDWATFQAASRHLCRCTFALLPPGSVSPCLKPSYSSPRGTLCCCPSEWPRAIRAFAEPSRPFLKSVMPHVSYPVCLIEYIMLPSWCALQLLIFPPSMLCYDRDAERGCFYWGNQQPFLPQPAPTILHMHMAFPGITRIII